MVPPSQLIARKAREGEMFFLAAIIMDVLIVVVGVIRCWRKGPPDSL